VEDIDTEMVVEVNKIIEAIPEIMGGAEQLVVIGMKEGKFEIMSSHSARTMENMIDDALDALYSGEIGFDEADEGGNEE
jgi:hypothetical protein